jgi:hypothetical protein
VILAGWPTSGLVDKQGQELVELKLQVLVEVRTSSVVDDPKRKLDYELNFRRRNEAR